MKKKLLVFEAIIFFLIIFLALCLPFKLGHAAAFLM